jgi:hypothetical protein
MRWTTLQNERGQEVLEFTNTFHTLGTKMGIKYFERHLVMKYRGIDTSKLKWILWTSHHWVLLIDMLLKSSRNLGTITNQSSGMQISNNQIMIKTTLTNNLLKNSPSHMKRRVGERQRMTLEDGETSTKSPGTTSMNVTKNNHWWLISKKKSRTQI